MNVGVHWPDIVGGEEDAVIMRGVDVVEDVKRSLHVTSHGITCVE